MRPAAPLWNYSTPTGRAVYTSTTFFKRGQTTRAVFLCSEFGPQLVPLSTEVFTAYVAFSRYHMITILSIQDQKALLEVDHFWAANACYLSRPT